MDTKKFRSRSALYAFALVAVVLVGTMAWTLSTTYFTDDITYSFTVPESENAFWRCRGEALISFGQVPESIWNHYRYVNGRLANIIHISFQPLPREVECVVNSLMIVLMFIGLLVFAVPEGKRVPTVYGSTAALVFLGMAFPWFDSMQSADYLVNYVWTSVGALLFLFLWLRIKNLSRGGFVAYVVFTVFFAWMHEGFTCPMIAFAFFDILSGGNIRSRRHWLVFGALCTGLIACVSVATINRAVSYLSYTTPGLMLAQATHIISTAWPLYVALVLMLFCHLRLRESMKGKWHFILSLFVAALIGIIMASLLHVINRGVWASDLFSVVICLRAIALLRWGAGAPSQKFLRNAEARSAGTALFCAAVVLLTSLWFMELVRWQRRITAEEKTFVREFRSLAAPTSVIYSDYTTREEVPFYLMGIPYHAFDDWANNTLYTYHLAPNDSTFVAVLPPEMSPEAGDSIDAFSRLAPLNADGSCRGKWPFIFSKHPDGSLLRVEVAEINGSVNPLDRLIIALRHGCPARRHSYYLWSATSPVFFPDGTKAYMHLPYMLVRSAFGRRIVEVENCALSASLRQDEDAGESMGRE